MDEEWRDIEGWEGIYQVSSKGRVKRLQSKGADGRTFPARMIKPGVTRGYAFVALHWGSTKEIHRVNRLVAETFIDNPNKYPVVEHIDTNRLNNTVSNLRWCTQSSNCMNTTTRKKRAKYMLNGELLTDVARRKGVSYYTLIDRIKIQGMTIEEACNV